MSRWASPSGRALIRRSFFTTACMLAAFLAIGLLRQPRAFHRLARKGFSTYISSELACPDCVPLLRSYLAPYKMQRRRRQVEAEVREFLHGNQHCTLFNVSGGRHLQNGRPDIPQNRKFSYNVERAVELYGPLPHMEFFFCFEDWPIMSKAAFPEAGRPPLCYSMHPDFHCISVPYHEQNPSGETEALREAKSLQEAHPWQGRNRHAYWRGSTTGRDADGHGCGVDNWSQLPRVRLVELSLQHPDLLDARFFANSQCPQEVATELEKGGYGFTSSWDYRNLLNHTMLVDVDGNGWSSRLPSLLTTGSIVFKQASSHTDWFFSLLKPYQHFVPVKADLSDLVSLLRWGNANKDTAALLSFGQHGLAFYEHFLTPSKQLCYLHLLLTEYGKLGMHADDDDDDDDQEAEKMQIEAVPHLRTGVEGGERR